MNKRTGKGIFRAAYTQKLPPSLKTAAGGIQSASSQEKGRISQFQFPLRISLLEAENLKRPLYFTPWICSFYARLHLFICIFQRRWCQPLSAEKRDKVGTCKSGALNHNNHFRDYGGGNYYDSDFSLCLSPKFAHASPGRSRSSFHEE